MIKPRESILNFADWMESKLRKNDYKGGWSECDGITLLAQLGEEFDELESAIMSNKPRHEIVEECADIANFAMMISENYKPEEKE